MARPSQFSESDYRTYIEAQLGAGRSIDEITASELQAQIGGKYQKCQSMLTQISAEIVEEQGERAPEMPSWFKEFVGSVERQAKELAQHQWLSVGREIKRVTDEATQAFEDKIAKHKVAQASHLEAIDRLETKNELLETGNDSLTKRIEEMKSEIEIKTHDLDQQKMRIGELMGETAKFEEMVSQLREDKAGLQASNSALKDQLESQRDEHHVAIGKLTEELSTLRAKAERVPSLEQQVQTLTVQLSEASRTAKETKEELTKTSNQREDIARQAALEQEKRVSAESKIVKLEAQAEKSESGRVDALENAARLAGKVEALEAQLKAKAEADTKIKTKTTKRSD